jgi:hypothetical protein
LPVSKAPLLSGESARWEQASYYASLIDEQLLALTTISRQTLSFYHSKDSVEPIVIAQLVEAALRIHRKEIAAKAIRVIKKLPGDMTVESHAGSMLQIWSATLWRRYPPKAPWKFGRGVQTDKRMSSLQTMEAEFLPQSGARSSNYFSVQKESVERGWGWISPNRSSSGITAGSEIGQARASAEAELPSVSRCRFTLSLLRLRDGVRTCFGSRS